MIISFAVKSRKKVPDTLTKRVLCIEWKGRFQMAEKRKAGERRKKQRRKLLTEKQFRKLIEEGKVSKADRREYEKRRKTKRRKKQMGV